MSFLSSNQKQTLIALIDRIEAFVSENSEKLRWITLKQIFLHLLQLIMALMERDEWSETEIAQLKLLCNSPTPNSKMEKK